MFYYRKANFIGKRKIFMSMYPKGRQKNIVVQKLESEVLVYDLSANKAVCLNETSALVWQMCDGKTTVSEIAEKIVEKISQPVTDELVWLAIEQLKKENLLINSDDIESYFAGLSRREVIRKVGMASMVALPIISSITAPTSAQAQSCSGTINVPGGGGGCQANAAACTAFSCRCIPGNGAIFTVGALGCTAPTGACICNP